MQSVWSKAGIRTVVTLSPRPLAGATKEIQGLIVSYIVQVQGYAAAVGSVALNQKLSREGAENAFAHLEQDGAIPLTNILAPGAASNNTAEGQAENRRAVVRILQNKGIAGT